MLQHVLGFTRMGRPIFEIAGAEGEGAGGSPAAGTDAGGHSGQSDSGSGGDQSGANGEVGGEDDPAKLKALVDKLRPFERGDKVSPKVQKQIDSLAAKVREYEEKDLSEAQKLSRKLTELEAENIRLKTEVETGSVKRQISEAATAAGAKYPDDAWKLLDLAEISYDDSGRPKNLTELIGKVKESRPDYFKPGAGNGSADGGVRTPAGGGRNLNDLLRQAARGGT